MLTPLVMTEVKALPDKVDYLYESFSSIRVKNSHYVMDSEGNYVVFFEQVVQADTDTNMSHSQVMTEKFYHESWSLPIEGEQCTYSCFTNYYTSSHTSWTLAPTLFTVDSLLESSENSVKDFVEFVSWTDTTSYIQWDNESSFGFIIAGKDDYPIEPYYEDAINWTATVVCTDDSVYISYGINYSDSTKEIYRFSTHFNGSMNLLPPVNVLNGNGDEEEYVRLVKEVLE